MRAKIRSLLFGLAIGAALTGPAMAEEQMVMPFACSVAGGKVLLAPSAPQAYQIYGHREQKQLTTCSPFDPRNCQSWSIHRFDLDCGGVRTSWQSVVAAMTPLLVESLGEPGSGYAGPSDGPAGVPYRPRPGPVINFPPGFAPNPMMVASFKQTKAAPAQIALPHKKPDVTAPSQTAETEPNLKPPAAPSSSGGEAHTASKTAPIKRQAIEVAKSQPLKIEIDSGSGEVTGSLPKSGATSGTLWREAAMVFALTLAVLLALSATLLLRQRRAMPLAVAQLPHGPATRRSLTRTSNSGVGKTGVHKQRELPGTRLRLWDEDWLPTTISEAFDVLGVDPEASRDTMKTTVTRLRRALHPDYALDEEDRRLRERRLKQINVAWDIVSGKRRSLWFSLKPRSS